MQGPGGWYSSTATRATSRCPTPRSRSARWPAAGARPSPPASCPAVRWAGNIFVIYQIFFENTRKSTELAISHLVIHTHGKTEISFLLHISMTVSQWAQFGWGLAQTNKCKRHSWAQKCTKMWISTTEHNWTLKFWLPPPDWWATHKHLSISLLSLYV